MSISKVIKAINGYKIKKMGIDLQSIYFIFNYFKIKFY